ncbi:MAG: PQQ-binding-like beta-propeller repeat protein [Planctomycetia bacterium]|nr:PQQ-binding-like beta-propeller repeat protein [Planctomycetia bacterium]
MRQLTHCFWSLVITVAFSSSTIADNWPGWRGPRGEGTCAEKGLPSTWSTTENVAWRIALPERGNSTPVVWGNRVFVTQAIEKEGRRTLMCFDRKEGKLLWQKGTEWKEKELSHDTNPYCASSAVTDGERVVAWFGSAGIFCYDNDGNELWKRDLGIQKHIWGYGASPVLHGELCYLNFGPGERSFLISLNKKTGETVWNHDEPYNKEGTDEAKSGNPDYTGSWSSPLFRGVNGRNELLISFPFRVCGMDPATGKEFWTCTGTNALAYTSPLFADGIVVGMGGYNGMSIALKAGGSGDVTKEQRLWRHPKTKQRIGSGVIHNGHIYIHNDPGIAECFELATGKLVWEERLKGGANWSSVMLADGLCYTITQAGECNVFKASPKFELVATNLLGEQSNSSIVPSDGQLFIRTHQNLWCIGSRK